MSKDFQDVEDASFSYYTINRYVTLLLKEKVVS